jgi:predicted phosphodiesterase
MRLAIISDVHANVEALQAVMKDIKKRKLKEMVFLGDAVGYGPNPNECIEILTKNCRILLAGNHDWASIDLTEIEYFNQYAKAAILWTKGVLSEENRKLLKTFPIKKELNKDKVLLVHSTPKEPEAWHYLLTLWDAEINFHYFNEMVCLIGHSHLPFVIERLPSGEMVTYNSGSDLKNGQRYIINCGSVGQPRDRDPRACYAIMDDERVDFVRVEYDVKKTQKKMREAGLPLPLIERLSRGT